LTDPAKRKDLGIAVVGSGRIGTLRARLAARHPAVRFLAVADKDPARPGPTCTPATTTR
jgi:threonine dehydrogenase-like Zn-dependent dehydrogenase